MINRYLTPEQQGFAAMAFGFILLLYALGIFAAGFAFLIILISVGLIVYGFVQSNLYHKIIRLTKRKKDITKK